MARACEDRLANSRLMKKFIAEMEKKESELTKKFSNFLGEAISRLKKIFQQIASKLSRAKEAQQLRGLTDKLEAIQSQYDALLERRTAEPSSTSTTQQKNTSDRGVMLMSRYEEGIDQLIDGTFDFSKNTHLRVLDETPKIYIDKANAKNLEIIIPWDIAYLALNKKGEILGNYHGLGSKIMKKIPDAIKNPLYIVKQKNGRIAAISELIVKNSRAAIISIELETFKTTVQSGSTKSDFYNLIVTVLDAKPNYLQNNIFAGEVVFNKNNETPAHFILRLKSLNKALPANDLTEVSKTSISNPNKSVKSKQLDIINETNPAPNSYSAWIRTEADIKTLQEAISEEEWAEYEEYNPDLSRADLENAIQSGSITVYSSYPIENGVFVTPSRMEAESYSENGKIYQKTVNVSDVAWIDPTQGQYAKVGPKVESKGEMKADRESYETARELLLQAASDEELKKSEIYSPLLREYVSRIDELDRKYARLEDAEQKYLASMDAQDSTEQQEKYKKTVDSISREIERIESDLSKQEESKELKAIVRREKAATRKQTLKESKADTAQRMSEYRKSIERKGVLERIDAKRRVFQKKLSDNTRTSHIPDDLKQPLERLLKALERENLKSQTASMNRIKSMCYKRGKYA